VRRLRSAFVIEQTLGHVAHSRNLERHVAARPDVEATFVKLDFDAGRALKPLPGLGSWSVRASWTARSALRHLAGGLDAAFIHTQVAALMSEGVARRVPTVVSLDATPVNFDSQGEAYHHRPQWRTVERFKHRINRRALHGASRLVTWCEWAKRSLISDYGLAPDGVAVIHPGVDLGLFRPAGPRRAGPPRVLFVGGDFERKGGHDLLDAWRTMRSAAELSLVTSPPGGLAAPPGVTVYTGLKPQSETLIHLYRDADVFVLPSRGDCFPQAVAEAMACGVPAVVSNVGALPEMVQDGVNGHVVQARAPRELALALERLVTDPAERRRMGAAGLKMACRDHDARRNCDAICDLLHEVAAARRPPR
jgi:glycosyltransferase involved in cell wall biosynthesis